MSEPYSTCRRCGAHLDHGEHCECEKEQEETTEEKDKEAVD